MEKYSKLKENESITQHTRGVCLLCVRVCVCVCVCVCVYDTETEFVYQVPIEIVRDFNEIKKVNVG